LIFYEQFDLGAIVLESLDESVDQIVGSDVRDIAHERRNINHMVAFQNAKSEIIEKRIFMSVSPVGCSLIHLYPSIEAPIQPVKTSIF